MKRAGFKFVAPSPWRVSVSGIPLVFPLLHGLLCRGDVAGGVGGLVHSLLLIESRGVWEQAQNCGLSTPSGNVDWADLVPTPRLKKNPGQIPALFIAID